MRKQKKIAVIIPALNEEKSLPKVINEIPEFVDKIIVVDNNSQDNSAKVASEAGAIVLHEPLRGYGAACLKGLMSVDTSDIIVFLDGDYSDYPNEMTTLVDPIIDKDIDLVIGSRTIGKQLAGALTPQQKLGNALACRLMHLFWKATYTDLGPFRAIKSEALNRLEMSDKNYGWTIEMQIKAAIHRLKIMEVPVRYRRRIGTSKISGTLSGTLLASIKILSVIGRYAIKSAASSLQSKNRDESSRPNQVPR